MRGPEAIIEENNVEYAESFGLLTLKLRLLGTIGWPDRIFLAPGASALFIEYKAPGKKPKPHQVKVHQLLKRYGFYVYVVDDAPAGRELLRRFAEGEALPETGAEVRAGFFKSQNSKLEEFLEGGSTCPKHTTGGGPCYCGRKPRG